MSWIKKATVNYSFLDTLDDEYFVNFYNTMTTLINTDEVYGTFEANEAHFLWKINSVENITDTETFFISLVKEKYSWPVWYSQDGDISSVPLNNGSLGELYYAYINPASKFMLTVAAATGAAQGSFKKFLNEFSADCSIKLTPLFEDNIDSKILSWDYYKKISTSLNFPTHDDLIEFITTSCGKSLGITDELGSLKFDITLSAPKQKQVLDTAQIQKLIGDLYVNDFCSKLVVRGANFETELLEEYDIKNAQIKYNEEIEILDSYMSLNEARKVLNNAFTENANKLLRR